MPKIELTNLGKIFFPQAKITKGDLADYYQQVAGFILPYLKDRPHSLLRQPDGISGESFFQKDVDHNPPAFIKTLKIRAESTGQDVHYLVCQDLDSLRYMVQLGCIEINPWNSRVGKLDNPDWLIIDLDPEAASFDQVIDVAQAVHKVCQDLKIAAYPKTSGKSGIHIYIPTAAGYSYEKVRQLAEALAREVNQRQPKKSSIERQPAKRRGRVYVDYLQNSQGQTVAAPYSVRPTPPASVSTPLHWDEVKKGLEPQKFTVRNTPARLKRVGDLWKPVLGKGIDIPQILEKIE